MEQLHMIHRYIIVLLVFLADKKTRQVGSILSIQGPGVMGIDVMDRYLTAYDTCEHVAIVVHVYDPMTYILFQPIKYVDIFGHTDSLILEKAVQEMTFTIP